MRKLIRIALLFSFVIAKAQNSNRTESLNAAVDKTEQQVINCHHDFNEHPELGNQGISHGLKAFWQFSI